MLRPYRVIIRPSLRTNYYDMIYLLTAIWLSPGGSSTVHIYTQTIHRTTQITINVVEGEPCPVFESFTLAFALQLRKKHGKTSVRLRKTSVRVQYTYYQKKKNLHTYTLQNNIKPPQYKLKQTQYKIYPNEIVIPKWNSNCSICRSNGKFINTGDCKSTSKDSNEGIKVSRPSCIMPVIFAQYY